MTLAVIEGEPRRRLHPLTPLIKGAKFLAAAVAAISWQGLSRLGFASWLGTVALLMLGGVAVSAVSWLTTGFHVVGRELRISEGFLWRRTRAIPLERVQAVDIERPLLARLTGLAELRLEVVGADKAEAPLAFLALGDATRLRERLLALVSTVPTAAASINLAKPADAAPVPALHSVPNRDVLLANALTPGALLLPFALAVTVLANLSDHRAWGVIGVASFATALIGVVLPVVRRVLADWHFQIAVEPAGLRLRHGLVDIRSRTVPTQRVQAVGVTTPLLWRPKRWLRTRLDVAGVDSGGERRRHGVEGGVLLPVADRATTRSVIARVAPDLDIDALPLRPIPRIARLVSPLAWRKRSFGYTPLVVAARDGWATEQLIVARLARVQSVRVVQGPIQRWLGLADLHVDTAGGLHVVGRDRAADEAYALAADLADASRSARLAERVEERVDQEHRSASPTTTSTTTTYDQPTSTSTT